MPRSLTSFFKNYHYQAMLCLIFLLGVALFAILILLDNRTPNTDDTVFITQILPYPNVIEWVTYRYQTWSGRIFSEGLVYIFSPAPLIAWKIVTVLVYSVFSLCIYGFYTLFAEKRNTKNSIVALSIALALPFLMNYSVFIDSILWVTGSMVYFWITTLAMLSIYPVFFYIVKRKCPPLFLSILGFIAGIIAAGSQEQVGAVLCGLSIVLLGYEIGRRKKAQEKLIPKYLLLFVVLAALSFLVSVLAPGNDARIEAEINTWLPNFTTVSLAERFEYGYRWVLEALVNHSGFLLVTVWACYIVLLAVKGSKRPVDYTLMLTFTLAALIALSKDNATTGYWLEFFATWKPTIPHPLFFVNLIVWTVILILTAVTPLYILKRKKIGYLLCLLLLACYASTSIMVLSPTIYASQWRSFFIPSVLLIICAYILLNQTITKIPKYKYLILSVIICIALSQYIFQAIRLITIF